MLDEDSIAFTHAMQPGEFLPDRGNGADVLVPPHDHRFVERRFGVHLDIRAADPCDLDFQKRGIIGQFGPRQLPQLGRVRRRAYSSQYAIDQLIPRNRLWPNGNANLPLGSTAYQGHP